jgi:hypothetical protein
MPCPMRLTAWMFGRANPNRVMRIAPRPACITGFGANVSFVEHLDTSDEGENDP